MATATVTSKGQITLPKSIREHLRLDTGDVIDFIVNDEGEVIVRPITGDIMDLKGILHQPGRAPLSIEEMDAAILRAVSRKR